MIGSIWGAYGAYGAYGMYGVYGRYGGGAQSPQNTQAPEAARAVRGPSGVLALRRPSSPETPVQPVSPVTPVSDETALPIPIRLGADPVEMAVRMRIQYPEDPRAGGEAALGAAGAPSGVRTPGTADIPGAPEAPGQGAQAVQEAAEEGECQTCKERKYQDGSDDMGVSFKTPTRIDPDRAASAVRGHEMEHVVREQAKARREDRRVVSQSVTYHTAICPECGRAYVSGGTTRTVTAAKPEEPQETADTSGGLPQAS